MSDASYKLAGQEIPATTGDDLVRFVRALGKHRYVSGRLHLVHAFAIDAASKARPDEALTEAASWAKRVLDDSSIDRGSKDERLLRRANDVELVAVLTAFWSDGPWRGTAAHVLADHLADIDCEVDFRRPPFDETTEDDIFPVLVDAGWELLPLAQLDATRHRGVFDAFDDVLSFDVAKFEEENAVPARPTLHELPLLGARELMGSLDDLETSPFVLWATGHETYLDYVLRGVLKVSGLTETPPA